ncbi:MAG: amino acid ABC transporter permease [Pseudomonadota bacterium]
MTDASFVRHEALPPAPPPASETGMVHWLRANLFSGWINSALTILAILAIYALLARIVPWVGNGVWAAESLTQCREVLDGLRGGCFAVISARWHQLVFGFYPSEGYWRPLLSFVLLCIALAPVLFDGLPKALRIVTLLFPFVTYWLIWGGPLWSPMLVLAAFGVGYLVYERLVDRSFALGFVGGAAALILFLVLLHAPLTDLLAGIVPLALPVVESREIGGFLINFILGTTCITLSLPIGIALALGRQSDLIVVRWLSVIFIEFIRGVPLITLLFVANVVLAYFLPPGTTFDLILRVVIMITLFASAYIAEVVRGGLAALPRGQYEAADSLGLTYSQMMRFIILPQALKISIPGIVNVAIGLFKDTTLVSVISMFDMIGMIRGPILSSTEWNGIYWELFGFAAVLFFVFCYAISQYSQYLEQKLKTDHR